MTARWLAVFNLHGGSLRRRRAIGPLLDRLERHAPALDRIETRPAPAETHDLVRSRLGTDVESKTRRLHTWSVGDRTLVLGASAGFDAEIMRNVSGDLKARIGYVAVVLAGLEALLRYDPPRLKITGTDEGGPQSSLPAPPSSPPARSAMGGGR